MRTDRGRDGSRRERTGAGPPEMQMAPQVAVGSVYQPRFDRVAQVEALISLAGLGDLAIKAAMFAFFQEVGSFAFKSVVQVLDFVVDLMADGGPSTEQEKAAAGMQLDEDEQRIFDAVMKELGKARTRRDFAPRSRPAAPRDDDYEEPRPSRRRRPEPRDDHRDDYDDEPRGRRGREPDDDDDDQPRSRTGIERRVERLEGKFSSLSAKVTLFLVVVLFVTPLSTNFCNRYVFPSIEVAWDQFYVRVICYPGAREAYNLEKAEAEAEEARNRAIRSQAAVVQSLIEAGKKGDTAKEAEAMVILQQTSIGAYSASRDHAQVTKRREIYETVHGRRPAPEAEEAPPAAEPQAEKPPVESPAAPKKTVAPKPVTPQAAKPDKAPAPAPAKKATAQPEVTTAPSPSDAQANTAVSQAPAETSTAAPVAQPTTAAAVDASEPNGEETSPTDS